jgi:Skp family chaperone for outer membrane proteins
MSTVVQKFDADGKSVERELEKMRKEYDKLIVKMESAGRKSKKSTDDATTGMAGYAKGLATAVGGALSLHTALQLVTKEMSNQKKAQEDIARRSLPIAASQDLVGKMIGNVGAASEFLDKIRAIQRDTVLGRSPN